ncbi:putative Zn finger-like uncharacterized protein [Rhodovulum imhoffii]|uniref:Putative Zn finger-like uncharacterized protein n=1 Tax=Rhodovulum imhoffii TaxID=365340 RepID=A0A2T5BUM4_9RHOB|nr:zinc-ribbon domain-containing protein [Rhodovulum imhoffii]MBK5934824.1 hypothetical protein [Rhodovulum imhoffii]PTN03225.1 putative Zn finger-like uncharacterized protein [Rhodovulum imhoffii]
MELTCEKCGARYQIEDRAIPVGGRKVKCSACAHAWHQPAPAARKIDESVLNILREEVAYEQRARAQTPPRPEDTPPPKVQLPAKPPAPGDPPGFAIGFWGTLAVAALALGVYILAPQIRAARPEAAQTLDSYTTIVGQTRQALHRALENVVKRGGGG